MEKNSARYIDRNQANPQEGSLVSIHQPAKRLVLYIILFTAIFLVLNYFIIGTGPETGVSQNRRLIFILSYLAIGVAHIFIFPKWLPHLNNKDLQTGILYTLLLALISAAGAYLLFTFSGFHIPLLAIATACAFLLPASFQQAWNYFDFFSAPSYPPWLLPTTPPTEKKATIFLNSMELRIKIKVNYFDVSETTFLVTAPGRSLLGSMFHGLLLEGEAGKQGVQLTDGQQNPYAWRFFLQRPMGAIVLNPDLTLAGNKLKQKDTILAERIKMN